MVVFCSPHTTFDDSFFSTIIVNRIQYFMVNYRPSSLLNIGTITYHLGLKITLATQLKTGPELPQSGIFDSLGLFKSKNCIPMFVALENLAAMWRIGQCQPFVRGFLGLTPGRSSGLQTSFPLFKRFHIHPTQAYHISYSFKNVTGVDTREKNRSHLFIRSRLWPTKLIAHYINTHHVACT